MGNMLPCLVQGTTLPASMSPKQRLRSLKLLMKALNKMKKRPCNKAKIASKSSPSESATAGGGEKQEEVEVKSKASSKHVSPRRAAHGGRGGGVHRKGVVRVKVVLTKEEAARLLSLTAVGGQKTAAQIVAEIKRMEARRAGSIAGAPLAWRPALESIPEESP